MNLRIIAGMSVLILAFLYVLFEYHSSTDNPPQYAQISRYALLDADDVKLAIKAAVKSNDELALASELERVVNVARQMPLSPEDINYLESQKAKEYVIFHARRGLFEDEVINRFIALSYVDDLKLVYPEAKDRFESVDSLIVKRDKLFSEIESALLDQGLTLEQATEQARLLWRERFDRDRVQSLLGQ